MLQGQIISSLTLNELSECESDKFMACFKSNYHC